MAIPGAVRSLGALIGGALVAFATALVILGVAVLPLLTPVWIHLEQERAGAAALTGYPPAELSRVTDAIVGDLLFGGGFAVTVGGRPVLDPNEQAHMRDVRRTFAELGAVVVGAAAVLAATAITVALLRHSGPADRAAAVRALAWTAIRRGAASLAVLLAVLGVVAVLAFDAAFEIFHRVLFPGGNYTFDPRTEKLVQLFPVQFWSDTALAWGLVALGLALAVSWYAGRRLAR